MRILCPITVHYTSVGHAAGLALELASPHFGIHEGGAFPPETRAVFPGCPETKDGYLYANEAPGLGIDIDEKLAAKYPFPDTPTFDHRWGTTPEARWHGDPSLKTHLHLELLSPSVVPPLDRPDRDLLYLCRSWDHSFLNSLNSPFQRRVKAIARDGQRDLEDRLARGNVECLTSRSAET